jgi:hypothetical protein
MKAEWHGHVGVGVGLQFDGGLYVAGLRVMRTVENSMLIFFVS